MRKPFKHHPLVNVKDGRDISPIVCSSREEMDQLFLDLAAHYGAEVTTKHARECFVIPVKIKGARSRSARNSGTHYTPWTVVKHVFPLQGRLGKIEEQYRVKFSQVGSYSAGYEAIKASYPNGGWPE